MTNELKKQIKVLEAQIKDYDSEGRVVKKALAELELKMIREELAQELGKAQPKNDRETSFTNAAPSDIINSKAVTITADKKQKGKGVMEMAKKATKVQEESVVVETTKVMVLVKDLAEEYDLEPKAIRTLLRANGYQAPKMENVDPSAFGPKTRYEWAQGSKELAAVRKLIENNIEPDDDEPADVEPEPEVETPKKKKAK